MRLLAVPNVSEGRDEALISRLASAFGPGEALLDVHVDADHNRSVFTLAADDSDLAGNLLAGAAATVEAIDMRAHQGAHPCIGALDVCPAVWPAPEARGAAEALAKSVAERLATELSLPVFLYGALATAPERRERAYFRRGGPPEMAQRMAAGELVPDLGPPVPHPTAGAVLATARPPLVAFNLELDTADVRVARAIADELRESGGGPPGVRAIGLLLSNGHAQLSTNVQDPFSVPLAAVVAEARRIAAGHGAVLTRAELVGLAPAAAFRDFPGDLRLPGFDPDRHLIERRLAGLS